MKYTSNLFAILQRTIHVIAIAGLLLHIYIDLQKSKYIFTRLSSTLLFHVVPLSTGYNGVHPRGSSDRGYFCIILWTTNEHPR